MHARAPQLPKSLTTFARTVLLGYLAVAGLLLLYGLVRANALIPDLATPVRSIFFIYGLPTMVVAVCAIALRSSRENQIGYALSLLSVTFVVYLAEAFLTLRTNRATKIEIIKELRKKGIGAVPVVFTPALLREEGNETRSAISSRGQELLPLGSISASVNVYCKEAGDFLIFESDEHGFHNPRWIWSRTTFDIAALGDSFTQGACVPSDKNMIALIRQKRPATLNMGGGGLGPLVQLALLKEYLARVKPRTVLWVYSQNDLRDLEVEKKSKLLRGYLVDRTMQGLSGRQREIDEALRSHVDSVMLKQLELDDPQEPGFKGRLKRIALFFRIPRTRSIFVPRKTYTGISDFEIEHRDYPLFQSILRNAKSTVEGWGGRLVFVYLPTIVEKPRPGSLDQREFKRQLLEVVKPVGLPLIDLDETFASSGDPRKLFTHVRTHLISLYGHFNEDGYRLAAETILKRLEEMGR